MIHLAKTYTNISNWTTAVHEFQNVLNNLSVVSFHSTPLPVNESNEYAYTRCTSDESAKKYCPRRWEAMMKWFQFAEMV